MPTYYKRSLASATVIASSTALVLASAGFGAVYAWGTGSEHGPALGALSVLMALGLEGAKGFAVAGAFDAFKRWQLGTGVVLGLLALVAVVYSLTAELSLMATTRGDKVAERQAQSSAARSATGHRARIEAELASLPSTRTVAELKARIAPLANHRAGDICNPTLNPRAGFSCRQLTELRAELGRAARREHLEAQLSSTTDGTAAPILVQKEADPGAHALATYLSALGIVVPVNTLSEWLALIPVLALEIGAAFAVVLVRAASVNGLSSDVQQPAAEHAGRPKDAGDNVSAQSVQDVPQRLRIADHPAERLLNEITSRGGMVFGSQRTLAKLVGVSVGGMNAMLQELAAAGRVAVEASTRGTVVRLAAT